MNRHHCTQIHFNREAKTIGSDHQLKEKDKNNRFQRSIRKIHLEPHSGKTADSNAQTPHTAISDTSWHHHQHHRFRQPIPTTTDPHWSKTIKTPLRHGYERHRYKRLLQFFSSSFIKAYRTVSNLSTSTNNINRHQQ